MNKKQMGGLSTMLIFSAVVIGIMFLVAAWAWMQLPANASIPVHWGINGEVDRYGGKFEGLLMPPLITLGIVLLMAFIPRLDPRGENIVRSNAAYKAIWMVTMLFMLLIYGVALLAIFGWPLNIGRIVGGAVGILFIILGNYMGKIRSNYTMGIRTPWTLASELSWNKTHRLGGKLFVTLGTLTLVLTVMGQNAYTFYFMIIGLITTLVTVFAYSYLVWKNDPAAGATHTSAT
ncbi:MAG: SdpI family protein [Caldilineaceae bacterium]|nr:SdpI family protein [Caldilineaceae bacterium]